LASTKGKVQTEPEPLLPISTPHTCAIESGGLSKSPESFLRTPPPH
jgi:hypothetical protein